MIEKHYEELLKLYPKEQIFFIALQGSQNYNMQDDSSDVDTRAVILPSLDDLIFNRPAVSVTHIMDNGEHIDIKDIRLMFLQYRKQNINFIESLFSDYVIVNKDYEKYWIMLQDHREEIAHYNINLAIASMNGMIHQKANELTHPFPSREHFIEQYGYDGKQLCHMMRVLYFLKGYIKGLSYKECLIPPNVNYLLSVKRHTANIDLEQAKCISNDVIEAADKLKADYKINHPEKCNEQVTILLDNIQGSIIKDFLKEQINKEDQ